MNKGFERAVPRNALINPAANHAERLAGKGFGQYIG
jgi:hypothetical protein